MNSNTTITTFTSPTMADSSPPRISFSHDLHQSDHILHPNPSTTLLSLPSPSLDFNFRIKLETSSYADDLFSDGMILPLPLKHTTNTSTCNSDHQFTTSNSTSSTPLTTPHHHHSPTLLTTSSTTKRNTLLYIMPSLSNEDTIKKNESNSSTSNNVNKRSFWRFGRSSSLNKSSASAAFCRFSLSRSKSTGSSSTTPTRTVHRSTSYKQNSSSSTNSPSRKMSSSDTNAKIYYYSGGPEKSYGVRIGPVLNVPTPCSMNLLSYLLCSCGYKN